MFGCFENLNDTLKKIIIKNVTFLQNLGLHFLDISQLGSPACKIKRYLKLNYLKNGKKYFTKSVLAHSLDV